MGVGKICRVSCCTLLGRRLRIETEQDEIGESRDRPALTVVAKH